MKTLKKYAVKSIPYAIGAVAGIAFVTFTKPGKAIVAKLASVAVGF